MKAKWVIIKALIIAAGLGGGYLYYYLIGCRSGYCPITSNPYTSVIYGGIIGLLLSFSFPWKKKEKTEDASV